MIELAGDEGDGLRAFLTVAGRTIARHQLDLALALDCRRIVCLARPGGPPLDELEERAESGGARFNTITTGQRLGSLVGADDELLMFADGLLVEPAAAVRLLEPGPAVLTQAIEHALPAGFERLDINRGTAGIVLAPGKLVSRLAELPADYDPVSALTRIALQSGVAMREIPDAVRADDRWTLVRSEADALRLDSEWIALNLGDERDATPSRLLARGIIRLFGAALLGGGGGSRMPALGAGVLLLMALVAVGLGAPGTGFAMSALSVLAAQTALMLMRVEQGSLQPGGIVAALTATLVGLIDAALVVLVAWPAPRFSAATLVDGVFAPLALVGMLRLVPRLYESRVARWLHDRAIVALVLAVAAVLGLTLLATELMGLLLIGGALLQRVGAAARK
jgi:hypothetical protein